MKQLLRSLTILKVFAKYRLDTFIEDLQLPLLIRIWLYLLPWRYFIPATEPRAVRLRLAIEALGPVFIKFGQMLSTRRDLLPDDIADELKRLQDQVPPFDGQASVELVEAALGQPVSEIFTDFNITPLASASVAQVHEASFPSGEQVIVKVVRPGIEKTIGKDVGLLYLLASAMQSLWSEGRRLRPVEVVAEYEQTIFDELDLRKEAANGSQLRRNFLDSDMLYIPEIYWDYTRQNVLVMERIHGIPVAEIDQLTAQNTNIEMLAERGVEIFFTQVFRDSFFHADMHPGNIFVSRENPQTPKYIAVDFGIVGSLTPEDQNYLARNFLAFFQRDYRLVAQLHVDSGWVPHDTNVDAFETAIRSVCEPIFEKPLKEISFGQVLIGLFQTARRFNMEVQPQLVLLQKTLLNVEGLGRQLYPELDLWKTAKPLLEQSMKDRVGPKAAYKAIQQQGPDWIEKLPQMPQLVFDSLSQIRHLDVNLAARDERRDVAHQAYLRSRSRWRIVGVAIIFAGVVSFDESSQAWLSSLPAISWFFIAGGLYCFAKR